MDVIKEQMENKQNQLASLHFASLRIFKMLRNLFDS